MRDCLNKGYTQPLNIYPLTLIIFTITLVVSCSSKPSNKIVSLKEATATERIKNPLSESSAVIAGKSLYAVHCTMCHGNDGKGEGNAGSSLAVKPADLTMGDTIVAADEEFFLVVKNGIKKKGQQTMPPARKVTDEQIRQIVSYVHTLARK